MEWTEFYDQFFDWDELTQGNSVYTLKTFGDPHQVAEVAQAFGSEKAASRFIRKAINNGVQLYPDDICDLPLCVDAATVEFALRNSRYRFTQEQLEELWGYVDDDVMDEIAERNGVTLFEAPEQDTYDWATFYDQFYDWSEEKQIKLYPRLISYGDPREVAEVAHSFSEVEVSSHFIQRALNAGVQFPAEEISELYLSCDRDTMNRLVKYSKCTFTEEQLDILEGEVDDRILKDAAKRSGVRLSSRRPVYAPREEEIPIPDLGFFGTMMVANAAADLLFPDKNKPHPGHCTGDCANCPPHYGYRYGRWYYGRGHVHGCVFGGNKGDGGMD